MTKREKMLLDEVERLRADNLRVTEQVFAEKARRRRAVEEKRMSATNRFMSYEAGANAGSAYYWR